MTMIGNDFPVRANAFCLNSEKRASSADMSPAGTLCFDIFPPPGDSEVISQVERLSSKEMKIAPRSVWMALGASGRSAIICMAVSRVGGRNLTLPERRSLSTSPWDLDTFDFTAQPSLNKALFLELARLANGSRSARTALRSGRPNLIHTAHLAMLLELKD